MNKLISTTVAAVAALAVAVPVTAAQAAPAKPAATTTWTTIQTLAKAKQQACRVLADEGRAWKIKNRLVTTSTSAASGPIEATLRVTYKGKNTKQLWDSGYQKRGKVSETGVIFIPRKPDYKLVMTIHGTDFGNGGSISIVKIGVC